jgi:hypothetical protein
VRLADILAPVPGFTPPSEGTRIPRLGPALLASAILLGALGWLLYTLLGLPI